MYRRAFELNAMSAVRLARLVLPQMREQKWGRIINITSISSKQPVDGLLFSNMVRAGLTGWAKTVSNEVAADNVTVNNVAPGYTLTERQDELATMRSATLGKPRKRSLHVGAEAPIRRLGRPKKSAPRLPSSPLSASFITGVTLRLMAAGLRAVLGNL